MINLSRLWRDKMIKPYNFVLVILFVMIIISFPGCDRKASGNLATDETQETQDIQVTEETSSVEASAPFVVKQDIAYKCNNYYQDIYYGDFLGNDALELAFVYNDSMETHFFNLNGDVIEPIVLNDLYREIDTQTQAILNNRNFDVILTSNPNSMVTSEEETHASVLPEKLYLNIEKGKMRYSPIFKSISSVIDRETMRAVLSCRWMWTNGLQGDITLAEIKYDFLNEDIKRAVQQPVEMRYSDPKLVSRAFERSGLSLDLTYVDDMLVFYTLKLTNGDYTLGDAFKVGMSQDALNSMLGVPDLINSSALSGHTEWSYYVKNETGERLLNYYYGYEKVIFVFDQVRVIEIRVEIFSSPT